MPSVEAHLSCWSSLSAATARPPAAAGTSKHQLALWGLGPLLQALALQQENPVSPSFISCLPTSVPPHDTRQGLCVETSQVMECNILRSTSQQLDLQI